MIFNAYAQQKNTVSGITLVSCGHIFAKPNREIYRPNGRNDWLLFFIAKESETFYLEQTTIGNEGSVILFAPNEKQHHIYEGSKTAEFYYIHFKCDSLPDNLNIKSSKLYNLPHIRQVCDIFEEIIEETTQKAECYEKICIYKLLYLLSLIERSAIEKNSPEKENLHRIARAIQHMNKYYNSNYSLEDYASMCNMSKYHFLRVFEQSVGFTPLSYRNNIRLEHAAELLVEEELSVEEVSVLTGFSSASYFSSAFKSKYKMSPKKYQKQSILKIFKNS